MSLPSTLEDAADEWEALEPDERYRLLIDLGRALPPIPPRPTPAPPVDRASTPACWGSPMPPALKTDATLVRGCAAAVWVYPTRDADGRLRFLADSNAAITKGIIALILLAVQGRPADEVAALDIPAELEPFQLSAQLSSNRTQGVPNMIALIRETAARNAA